MALSATALAFAQDIRFRGPLEGASHYGVAGSPGGGPYFQLWLMVSGGVIERAAYQTHGCPSSMAVGGGLCRLIQNRDVAKVKTLCEEDLRAFVGALPEGKEFCFGLGIRALGSALEELGNG